MRITTTVVTHDAVILDGDLFYFDEFQVYGRAQLAILGDNTALFFREMIGDRTGAVHIGDTQVSLTSSVTARAPCTSATHRLV